MCGPSNYGFKLDVIGGSYFVNIKVQLTLRVRVILVQPYDAWEYDKIDAVIQGTFFFS